MYLTLTSLVRWSALPMSTNLNVSSVYRTYRLSTSLCFKNIKQLPCRCRSQKKSWMTGDRFGEWIRKLDSSLQVQDRKVVLLMENCPVHLKIKNLTNINLIFLPPNTTSVL